MARWLIALAVAVVSRPVDAKDARNAPIDAGFRLEEVHHKITTSTSVVAHSASEPSPGTVPLGEHLIAVERPGALDVVDARTGATVSSTRLAHGGIQAVYRPQHGDVLVKTK